MHVNHFAFESCLDARNLIYSVLERMWAVEKKTNILDSDTALLSLLFESHQFCGDQRLIGELTSGFLWFFSENCYNLSGFTLKQDSVFKEEYHFLRLFESFNSSLEDLKGNAFLCLTVLFSFYIDLEYSCFG